MNEVESDIAIRSIERKADMGDLPETAAYMAECEQASVWVSASGRVHDEETFATIHERWAWEDSQ